MSSDRFIFLTTRQLAAELTAEEEKEWQELVKDADNYEAYITLKRFWQQEASSRQPNVEKALQSVLSIINEETPAVPSLQKKRISLRPLLAIAALLVLIAGAAFFVYSSQKLESATAGSPVVLSYPGKLVEKQNSKGTRSIIVLADGSKVWLNADSRLQYPDAFTGNTREVALSGEAFFEVAKNKKKPFIIHLKGGTVRVLGTSFNIRAYDNAHSIETSVATGRVAFIPAKNTGTKGSDTTFLTKDSKAIYNIETGVVQTLATASAMDKAWTEGKLLFNDASMDDIATELERNFGKQVVINDDELHDYHLTGSFENNSLEEILYYLSKSKPFTYRITETQIILSTIQ